MGRATGNFISSNDLLINENCVYLIVSSMNPSEWNHVNSPPSIYVVDDEQMLLDLAKMILEPAGFQVCLFQDPELAFKEYTAAQYPPDVLVTDYAMGSMNGMDLIRKCKQIHPRQKTVLLSGTVDESTYAQSDVKPDRFLAKPYQINKLLEVIRTLLAQ